MIIVAGIKVNFTIFSMSCSRSKVAKIQNLQGFNSLEIKN